MSRRKRISIHGASVGARESSVACDSGQSTQSTRETWMPRIDRRGGVATVVFAVRAGMDPWMLRCYRISYLGDRVPVALLTALRLPARGFRNSDNGLPPSPRARTAYSVLLTGSD